MTLIRIAALFLLMGIAGNAQAQTYYPLNQPGSIGFGNFNFTLGTCTYRLNNGASADCDADNIKVAVTQTGNSLTLTYVNASSPGNPLLSQASANGCTCLQFELTVSNTHGLSSAVVTSTGYGRSGGTLDNWIDQYSTMTRVAEAGITTTGYQTVSSGYLSSGNPTSLNLELGLGVNAAYQPGVFSLNSASVIFVQAPEPSAILMLGTGVAGLLFFRSRPWRRVIGHQPADRMPRYPSSRAITRAV